MRFFIYSLGKSKASVRLWSSESYSALNLKKQAIAGYRFFYLRIPKDVRLFL